MGLSFNHPSHVTLDCSLSISHGKLSESSARELQSNIKQTNCTICGSAKTKIKTVACDINCTIAAWSLHLLPTPRLYVDINRVAVTRFQLIKVGQLLSFTHLWLALSRWLYYYAASYNMLFQYSVFMSFSDLCACKVASLFSTVESYVQTRPGCLVVRLLCHSPSIGRASNPVVVFIVLYELNNKFFPGSMLQKTRW